MGAAIQQRWTDEKTELLKTLFAQGDLSAERMSEALGVSRNAVLGKLDRLGLKRKDYVRGSHTLVPGKPPPKKRLVHYRDLLPDESPFAVSLFDVTEGQCRWPLGEPAQMMFCGDEKVFGHSYCQRHLVLAYEGAWCGARRTGKGSCVPGPLQKQMTQNEASKAA